MDDLLQLDPIPQTGTSSQFTARLNDEFGDFQRPPTPIETFTYDKQAVVADFLDSGIETVPRLSGPEQAVNVDIDDDDDDFGDFMESPMPPSGHFEPYTATRTPSSLIIPPVTALCDVLVREVLQIPETFTSELGELPYPQRQAVLGDARTKRWLLSLLEGARVAQRIISGRKRRAEAQADDRSTETACIRLVNHWEAVMPRIKSLSNGQMEPQVLSLRVAMDGLSGQAICAVCLTGADAGARLEEHDGGDCHRSCHAFLKHNRFDRR